MMMARYRHRREALRHAARLLAQMLTGGGGEAVRPMTFRQRVLRSEWSIRPREV